MKNILIICNSPFVEAETNKLISKGYSFTQCSDEDIKNDKISLNDYNAIIMGGDIFLSKELLGKTSKLEIISFEGAGYASFMDVEYATEKGIAISNTPAVNADSVAEFSIGLMLSLLRKITFSFF